MVSTAEESLDRAFVDLNVSVDYAFVRFRLGVGIPGVANIERSMENIKNDWYTRKSKVVGQFLPATHSNNNI